MYTEQWGYETIKTLAKEQGSKVTDLIALANQNDPFYVGTDGDKKSGQWFADLWERFGYTSRVHLRRVHYQIVSQQTPVLLPDGTPYENTEAHWKILTLASKNARYLRLVDPGAFVDRRNHAPLVYTEAAALEPTIDVAADVWSSIELPELPTLPAYELNNYTAHGRQRYHVELWVEKTTMDDVLMPLCRRYGANLIRGVGELSITACLELTRSRMRPGQPVRLLYISDFDPAGQSMPVAVARKIEYFVRNELPEGADVRLMPIALSADQVQRYKLPRTPIKDTERRAQRFEDRYGEGAVELDALEALYPGELDRIVGDELRKYYDADYMGRVADVRNVILNDLEDLRLGIIEGYATDIDEIESEYNELRAEFRARVSDLHRRQSSLWRAIENDLHIRKLSLDDYQMPDPQLANEDPDVLYASERDYITQIGAYKEFQGKA